MRDIQKRIITYHEMLDAIRVRQSGDISVETLRDALRVSRTTADKNIRDLQEPLADEHIDGKPAVDESIIIRKERKILLNGDAAYFLGVSVGSSFVRAVLLGLDFKPVPPDIIENKFGLMKFIKTEQYKIADTEPGSYSFTTPPGPGVMHEIRELVKNIVQPMLDLHIAHARRQPDAVPFRLMGVGFAVAGPVDYANKVWISAPHIITQMRDIKIQDLMGSELYRRALDSDVFLSIDNNAKAAMVSEYQNLVERGAGDYAEDVATLYLGKGIGMAMVIDRKLIRGKRNLTGEAGHLRVIGTEPENYVPDRVIEEFVNNEQKENYITHIPNLLNAVICITGIENVIFTGNSVSKTSEIIPPIMDQRFAFTVASTSGFCKPVEGRNLACTTAIGAAIESYYSMCNFDFDSIVDQNWNENQDREDIIIRVDSDHRINLAHSISW